MAPIYFDAEGSLGEITDQFMKWYEGLEPFGTDFEVPIIKFSDVSVDQPRVLKGSHLKMWLRDHGDKMEAIWFFPPEEMLEKDLQKDFVDVLAVPSVELFYGAKASAISHSRFKRGWINYTLNAVFLRLSPLFCVELMPLKKPLLSGGFLSYNKDLEELHLNPLGGCHYTAILRITERF